MIYLILCHRFSTEYSIREGKGMLKLAIRTQLPGPEVSKLVERERKLLAKGTKSWDTPSGAVEASGSWFRDEDGNELMDWTNPMVVILGHGHPKWRDAMKDQIDKLVYFNSPDFVNRLQAETAELLCKLTPGNWDKKVFFSNSGTEANEAAIKIARISTGRNLIVSFIGGFHGRTTGTVALTTSKAVQRRGYTAFMTSAYSIPYANCSRCWYGRSRETCGLYCLEVIERYLQTVLPPEDIAAFIYEPIQGEGGYIIPPKEFIQGLHEIAKKYGILTIADEVQTGFGKTGYWFATEYFGVEPDIVTVAKGVANGMPMGATIFRADLDFPTEGMHSNTFGGLVLSMRSALETYRIIEEEKLLDRVRRLGELFSEKLNYLKGKHSDVIGEVRGLGFMLAIDFYKWTGDGKLQELAEFRDAVIREAYKRGLLLIGAGRSVIRITPAYTITEQEIETGIDILDSSIEAVKSDLK